MLPARAEPQSAQAEIFSWPGSFCRIGGLDLKIYPCSNKSLSLVLLSSFFDGDVMANHGIHRKARKFLIWISQNVSFDLNLGMGIKIYQQAKGFLGDFQIID
jgi:hypothetical protein